MNVGKRLKELRESQNLSQGQVERESGLLRTYLSRLENGHTVPTLDNLEKLSRAFKMPLYLLFYQGEQDPQPLRLESDKETRLWGSARNERMYLRELRECLEKMKPRDRDLLIHLAKKLATRQRKQA